MNAVLLQSRLRLAPKLIHHILVALGSTILKELVAGNHPGESRRPLPSFLSSLAPKCDRESTGDSLHPGASGKSPEGEGEGQSAPQSAQLGALNVIGTCKPRTVLVSSGSSNKAPQTGRLKTTETYSLRSGGSTSEVKVRAGLCSLQRPNSPWPPSLSWLLACGSTHQSLPPSSRGLSPCLCLLSSSCKDTRYWAEGPP